MFRLSKNQCKNYYDDKLNKKHNMRFKSDFAVKPQNRLSA